MLLRFAQKELRTKNRQLAAHTKLKINMIPSPRLLQGNWPVRIQIKPLLGYFCIKNTKADIPLATKFRFLYTRLRPFVCPFAVQRPQKSFRIPATKNAGMCYKIVWSSFLYLARSFVKMHKNQFFLILFANLAAKLLSLPSVLQNRLQNILLEC